MEAKTLMEVARFEQDADMTGLLYRTAYYAEDEEVRQAAGQRANLQLAKNRNGATGDVPLSFVAELMRFVPRVPRVPRVPDEADEAEGVGCEFPMRAYGNVEISEKNMQFSIF